MENSTIPLLTAITILGIITLLFFVNEFFRKYKIVKKQKPRKIKRRACNLSNPVLTAINQVSYNSKTARIISDAKKAIDKLPKDLSISLQIKMEDEILNKCRSEISKIK